MLSTPRLFHPETHDRRNLATGPLAEAALRTWASLQMLRGYRELRDPVGELMTLATLHSRAVAFPPAIRAYVKRALASHQAGYPQPPEAV